MQIVLGFNFIICRPPNLMKNYPINQCGETAQLRFGSSSSSGSGADSSSKSVSYSVLFVLNDKFKYLLKKCWDSHNIYPFHCSSNSTFNPKINYSYFTLQSNDYQDNFSKHCLKNKWLDLLRWSRLFFIRLRQQIKTRSQFGSGSPPLPLTYIHTLH